MKAMLGILMMAIPLHAAEPHSGLLLPSKVQTLWLPIAITVEGKAPDLAHEAFLDRLFEAFDRNGDGVLNAEEAGRIFALPSIEPRGIAMDFAKMDRDGDGKGTRAEFKQFYREAGFTPVVAAFSVVGADLTKANAILFERLDRDGDGRLSREELERAPALLKIFDADEDEVLTVAELLDTARAKEQPRKQDTAISWSTSFPKRPASALLRVNLGKVSEVSLLDPVSQSFEKVADEANAFRFADGMIRIRKLDADASVRLQATREFYLAPFKSALGDKLSLERKIIEDDASLSFLGSLLPFADRNGDNRLSLAELEGFLDLVEAGVRSQVVVQITDEGRSLFSLLDTNQDGRLDLRELNRAARLLPKGTDALLRQEIPRRVAVSIESGSPGKTFGPVQMVGNRASNVAKKTTAPAGPKWFQAMDRNGDGFLSPREFLGSRESFDALDTDKDGFISVQEAERGMKNGVP